jgi:hypothetical protein
MSHETNGYGDGENPETTNELRELHICPEEEGGCGSDLVYPLTWEQHDRENWHVVCRCPNCEHVSEGIYTQDECDHFDDHLEDGTLELTREFKRAVFANMTEEIKTFAKALASDAILPEDIGRIITP